MAIQRFNPAQFVITGSTLSIRDSVLSGTQNLVANFEEGYGIEISENEDEKIVISGIQYVAGDNISLVPNEDGDQITIHAETGGGGGGSGADSAASYIVLAGTASLPNERVLTAGPGIRLTDGGAGGVLGITASLSAGPNITINTLPNGTLAITGSASGADAAASYLVLAATASLANERVLVAGPGIRLTDGGAGGNLALSSSFIAGPNITIVSQSNGMVAISGSVQGDAYLAGAQNFTGQKNFAAGLTASGSIGLSGSLLLGTTAPLATSHSIGMANGAALYFRNFANAINISAISLDTNNYFSIGSSSSPLVTAMAGAQFRIDISGLTRLQVSDAGNIITNLTASGTSTYTGTGTISACVAVTGSTYTPSATESELELRVACTVTLADSLPNGTTFTFYDTTGAAATVPHALTPNNSKTINGTTTYSFNRNYGGQTVKKINGNWIATQ